MNSLKYMGAADALEVFARVSREIGQIEGGPTPLSEEQAARLLYLVEVVGSCETIVDFLNGEFAAFKSL